MTFLFFPILETVLRFQDDGDLARRLKAREPQALAHVYDRYGRAVYSVIYRMVRNTSAAEDLAQETFLRVWSRARAFDQQKGSLGPWILTIARNRAIDYLRSVEGRMGATTLELDRLEQPARFADLSATILHVDRVRLLKEAFEKLTPNQRTVIELAYFEGLSQTEMAGRLQQPLGTVKSWVRTALKVLRDELGEAATA